ncbi:hypothetical protein KEX41_28660 (plasmid) [Burkholderia thailandensis]|uniref:hypothetical protein n=1 Tax=Burkholderia thailandensis TaxID=57975 RepID=UPI00192E1205|nr:hypothetical protein [Burkholderia thailandensis]MBS2132159.1 hypothetical protein [Burkholderia thailandensis]QRA15262.1 hypothetical protein JMY07_29085 [Burkholderia thailandensis]
MFRWRIFILALALILGLPLELAGAASLPCQTGPTVTASAVAGGPHRAVMHSATGSRASTAVAVSPCDDGCIASMSASHTAGQCGMSASCFIGAGPAVLRIDEPRLAMLHAVHHVSDPASRFLTSGIDRPPRLSLV